MKVLICDPADDREEGFCVMLKSGINAEERKETVPDSQARVCEEVCDSWVPFGRVNNFL